MTVLSGQDSVSASGMTPGHDVYCGYGGLSSFSNMTSVMARFPGKKYVVFDTHVSHVDCYDVETGGGSAVNAPAFFRQWVKVHLNKPAFYASASTIGAVRNALTAAGISRSRYYLIVAQWDGSPAIPAGYDGKQYGNTAGYDSDSFESYMWATAPVPVPAWPLAEGSTDTARVTTLQKNLNRWAHVIGLHALLTVDGHFGALTKAAVTLAQQHFGERGVTAGVCTQSVYNQLAAPVPAPVPPPPPPPVTHKTIVSIAVRYSDGTTQTLP